MKFIFETDNDIKQDFLDQKPTATAESEAFVLRLADEYEKLIDKSIYNMTFSELKEMIAMQFKNTSLNAILKNVSILKTYIDFCISKKLVSHKENRLASFTTENAKEFVHKQALINKFKTIGQIKEYQNILYNEQDKLLILLPFIGVRGRTVEDGTLEEIINLSMYDVDEDNKMITLTQNNGKRRLLEVDTHVISLIKEVYEQEIYVENNGEGTGNIRLGNKPRETIINKVDNYVFRVPGKNKFQKFSSNLLNSRMKRIQKYLDNPYLTFTSLYNSGMIEIAMDIYKEKGEISKEDFVNICDKFNYGSGDPEKYWHNLKNLFEQYKELLLK